MDLLKVGASAPEFQLPSMLNQRVKLSDFHGSNVFLVFYPGDWSPVCSDQLAVYNELMSIFKKRNTKILGVSVDSFWCHIAFSKDRKFQFQLLSDFEPKGSVSKLYHAYRENDGFAERALYLIDEDGMIRWNYLSPVDVNPGADGIMDALDSLEQKKEKRYVVTNQTQATSHQS